MILVLCLDTIAILILVWIAFRRGFEAALPAGAFLLILFPVESQIHLPGLLDLTTARVVLITLTLLYLTVGRRKRLRTPRINKALMLPMALLIVWMSISSCASVVPSVSIKSVLSQCLDLFLPYYLFVKTVTQRRTVNSVLFAFILAMFLCCCLGIVETYRDWSILSIFPPTAHRFGGGVIDGLPTGDRIQTTFGHPILFGAGLAMGIPMALYLISIESRQHRKLFLWLTVFMMIFCIYKTASRGAWIALAISLAMLALGAGVRVRRSLVMITVLGLAVLVARPGIWMTLQNIQTATDDPESPRGMSYQWRYALYGVAWKQLGQSAGRALWGYGPESFFYLNIEDDFMGHRVKFESCDSSVVQLLIETGYVGMLIVAGLLITIIFKTYRNFRRLRGPDKRVSIVWLTNIFTFIWLMFSVAIWSWGQPATIFWVVVALSVRLATLTNGQMTLPTRPAAVADLSSSSVDLGLVESRML